MYRSSASQPGIVSVHSYWGSEMVGGYRTTAVRSNRFLERLPNVLVSHREPATISDSGAGSMSLKRSPVLISDTDLN